MTEIFLIRHGQAEGNLYRRMQGQTDLPLTPTGRAQLPYLTARFADVPLTAVYSSPLVRAVDTAEAARGAHPIPLHTDARLMEMCFGDWEGRPLGNIHADYPELNHAIRFDPDRFTVPGSEPHRAVQERMLAAMTDIGERHKGETVAVASHGMAIRAFFAAVLGVPSERIAEVPISANTAVALLRYEAGRFTIVYSSDTSHLPEPPALPYDVSRVNYLRFAPFDRGNGQELYLSCYRDAWQIAHGNLDGFNAEACWRAALVCSHRSPEALQAAYVEDTFAGVLTLDEFRGSSSGIGWLSFCYLTEEFRHQGCGAQLLGEAVAHFRKLGRHALQLTVAAHNPALGFYKAMGFRQIGREPGAREALLLMEKAL